MRILAIADLESPQVYASEFPDNLGPFDLVLAAGDLPAHVLEFVADRAGVPVVYVLGNHGVGLVRDPHDGTPVPVAGAVDAHGRVLAFAGLRIAGLEGSLRYRPGPHQYSDAQMEWLAARLAPRLAWNRLRHGRALDVLLTHAAPRGPHEGTDGPHRGVAAFNRIHRWWRPRLHVHGHVHLRGPDTRREYTTPEGVRVVNAVGATMIDL